MLLAIMHILASLLSLIVAALFAYGCFGSINTRETLAGPQKTSGAEAIIFFSAGLVSLAIALLFACNTFIDVVGLFR